MARILLLDDQSVDETTSAAIDVSTYDKIRFYVVAGGSVSGGVVTLEASPTSNYAGTWVSIGTVTTSAADTASTIPTSAVTATLGHAFVRARISTVISGGTVDVWLEAQE